MLTKHKVMVKFFLAEVALPRSEWAAYDPEPSYFDLFQAIYNTFTYEWVSRRSSDWAIVTFAKDIQESFALTRYDLFGILFVAAVLTILRSCLSKWVFQVRDLLYYCSLLVDILIFLNATMVFDVFDEDCLNSLKSIPNICSRAPW